MGLVLPHTFVNGETADASQMMENLDALLGAVNRPVVTALPGAPYDDQEILFLADEATGVVWPLKYRATASSPLKWEAIGPSALHAQRDADEAYPSTNAWEDASTAGPSLVVPLHGDYDYDTTADFYHPGALSSCGLALRIGADPVAVWGYRSHGGGGDDDAVTLSGRLLNIAAGAVVKMQYFDSVGAGAAQVRYRRLRLRPVRVG